MNKEDMWFRFEKTGKINDYIDYLNCKKDLIRGEQNINVDNYQSNSFKREYDWK